MPTNAQPCTALLPFGLWESPLQPHQISAVFFGSQMPGKWCSELGEKELTHSWGSEDLHRPCLYLIGAILLRGPRIQGLQEFHPGSGLGVRT